MVVAAAVLAGVLVWRANGRCWREGWSAEGAVTSGLLLATLLFHWQLWLLPEVSVPKGGGDLASFLYPTYRFAADSIQAGYFPFWNPRLYAGAPFAADLQSGLFYPPNLIAFLIVRPFTYEALETLAALHYPIAAITAYILARELGLTRLAAFASGLAFACSGFVVAHLGHYNMLAAAAWTPLALALLHRAVRTGRLDWAAAAAGAYALVLLPGHTQVALYAALAMTLVWAIVLWAGPRTRSRILALPVALGVGAAAAAVLLVPAFELTRLSIRADISYQQASEFAASPLGLITFLVPQFFGDSPNDYWGLRWSLQESYGYLGIGGLVLALLALVATGHAERRVALGIAGLGLLALLIALGETTPLHGYLYRFIPGFDKVRAPGRALLFVDLAGALLIGFGVQRLARPIDWRARPAARRLLTVLVVVFAAAALVAAPLFYYAALTSQDKDPAILRRVTTALGSLNLSIVFLAASIVVLWLWRRRRVPRALAPIAVGLLFLDVSSASSSFNPTTQDVLAGYRHEPILAFLRANAGDARIDTRTGIADQWQPDTAAIAGLDDVAGIFNPLQLRSFDRYWEALGSRSVPGYDLLAARYVVAKRDTPLDPARFQRRLDGPSGLAVFENAKALPRAFVAANGEVSDEARTADRLRDPAFDPRAVVLADPPVPAGPGGGTVESIDRANPNARVVRLRDVTGGALVLSEVAYPGWSATVDGTPAPVLRAYNALMAVPLPAGAREVRLEFRPRLFVPALALTLLGWLVIAAGAVRALRSRSMSESLARGA